MPLTEKRDKSGVTFVEFNDHNIGILVFALLIGQAWVYEIRHKGLLAIVMWEIAVLIGLTAIYLFTRKQVRIVVDPVRRIVRLNEKPFPMDQILRAEIASQEGERESPASDPPVYHRVELVMRSGERVPTVSGFGQFAVEDCHYLIDLINTALGVR